MGIFNHFKRKRIREAIEDLKRIEGKEVNYVLSKEDLGKVSKKVRKRARIRRFLNPIPLLRFLGVAILRLAPIVLIVFLVWFAISWIRKEWLEGITKSWESFKGEMRELRSVVDWARNILRWN